MAKNNKVNKHYVSPIDEKLAEFDRTHAPTPAQQAEIDRHAWIQAKRDRPMQTAHEVDEAGLWDE